MASAAYQASLTRGLTTPLARQTRSKMRPMARSRLDGYGVGLAQEALAEREDFGNGRRVGKRDARVFVAMRTTALSAEGETP